MAAKYGAPVYSLQPPMTAILPAWPLYFSAAQGRGSRGSGRWAVRGVRGRQGHRRRRQGPALACQLRHDLLDLF